MSNNNENNTNLNNLQKIKIPQLNTSNLQITSSTTFHSPKNSSPQSQSSPNLSTVMINNSKKGITTNSTDNLRKNNPFYLHEQLLKKLKLQNKQNVIEISITCQLLKENLKRFCKVYSKNFLGETEILKENKTFTKTFLLEYFFEKIQKIKIEIYNFENLKLLKEIQFNLIELILLQNNEMIFDIPNLGKVIITKYLNNNLLKNCLTPRTPRNIGSTLHQMSPSSRMSPISHSLKPLTSKKSLNSASFLNEINLPKEEEELLIKLMKSPLSEILQERDKIPEEINMEVPGIEFHCKGLKLDKKDTFGTSDPYFIFQIIDNNQNSLITLQNNLQNNLQINNTLQNNLIEIYKSEIIKNNLNPIWKEFKISFYKLCKNDFDKKILVTIYDWDRISKNDDLIGQFSFTINQLRDGQLKYNVIEPKKLKNKKNYVNSGIFEFYDLNFNIKMEEIVKNPKLEIYEYIIHRHSFLDYLIGGTCQLSMSILMDFTHSNGDINYQSGLHHIHGSTLNSYQRAIYGIGKILDYYCKDNISLYGFGAVPKNDRKNLKTYFTMKENLKDTNEVIECYTNLVNDLYFSDMTNVTNYFKPLQQDDFYPFINDFCKNYNPSKYNIIFILIDGDIISEDETLNNLILTIDKPISIIFIGIGGNSFNTLQNLISTLDKNSESRQNIQFILYNQFSYDLNVFVKKILENIPKQATDYYLLKGTSPNFNVDDLDA
ncbi:hypothetical protein ABK040_001641 [Willaertia magna]